MIGLLHEFEPQVIVHLAAQAGVRYSLENPRAYLNANVIGTFNVMETARRLKVKHLLMASTSSVYGANESMPFQESDKADMQLTFYAATKKAAESMTHLYSHIWQLPTTMFRFFTVYTGVGRIWLYLSLQMLCWKILRSMCTTTEKCFGDTSLHNRPCLCHQKTNRHSANA